MTKEEFIANNSFRVEVNGGIVEFHQNANGEIHREDGPAIVYGDGTMEWYQHDKLHRDNGPALDWSCLKPGAGVWFQNGKRHREDGPAVIYGDENMSEKLGERWYINGELHREDGPAIDYGNGKGSWWKHDKMHREDGPAEYISSQNMIWAINSLHHREDGPAEITSEYKRWFKHGKLHRVDGPAVVWKKRLRHLFDDEYYIDGKRLTEEEFKNLTKGVE